MGRRAGEREVKREVEKGEFRADKDIRRKGLSEYKKIMKINKKNLENH